MAYRKGLAGQPAVQLLTLLCEPLQLFLLRLLGLLPFLRLLELLAQVRLLLLLPLVLPLQGGNDRGHPCGNGVSAHHKCVHALRLQSQRPHRLAHARQCRFRPPAGECRLHLDEGRCPLVPNLDVIFSAGLLLRDTRGLLGVEDCEREEGIVEILRGALALEGAPHVPHPCVVEHGIEILRDVVDILRDGSHRDAWIPVADLQDGRLDASV
mmetsp:Transcript_34271/g.103458  ORF Transcript_34271/g.103458 Transcript_34271/m.103458 type:complete len:211 (+) Transcript_34271:300-932(+)